MAGENTVTSANGLYKKVYGTKLNDVRPKSSVLQEKFPFVATKRVGDSYNEGVLLQPPNGFTYSGSAGGVGTLNAASNAISKMASITPFELNLREQMAYAAMSRAVEQGAQAFEGLTKSTLVGMKAAHHNRIEASLLHGQRGYGTVESIVDNTTSMSIVITAATWAPGMWWAFGVGSRWDAYTSSTKNNASGVLTVTNITASTRTIEVTFTGTASSEVAAGDVLYPQGAYGTTADMLGLMSQASNTGSMFGIDAAVYPNWAGNSFACGGAITFAFVEECLANLRDRGADSTLMLGLSNIRYSALINELAQLRLISGEATSGKQGFRSVSVDSPEVGEVEIVRLPFMKQGEGIILPVDNVTRSGSSDTAFGVAGTNQGDVFMYVAGSNAVEVQTFSDQFAFLNKPSNAAIITGITS